MIHFLKVSVIFIFLIITHNTLAQSYNPMQSIFEESQKVIQELFEEGYKVEFIHLDVISDSTRTIYRDLEKARDYGVFIIGDSSLQKLQTQIFQYTDGNWAEFYSNQTDTEEKFIFMSIPWNKQQRYKISINKKQEARSTPSYFGVIFFHD